VVAPEPGVANAIAALRCRADLVREAFASGFQRPFPQVAICTVAPNCPRPASYWQMQAAGDGPYTLPDITALASVVDLNSVALDFGADPLGGFAAALAPGGDMRHQALREHAAFLANAWASQSALQPATGEPVVLNALTAVSCPGVPGSTTGELRTKAAEMRAVTGTYQNFVPTNRRALEGVDAGFSGFGGGAAAMWDFFGSSLDPPHSRTRSPRWSASRSAIHRRSWRTVTCGSRRQVTAPRHHRGRVAVLRIRERQF
jgi:hypothetical protein